MPAAPIRVSQLSISADAHECLVQRLALVRRPGISPAGHPPAAWSTPEDLRRTPVPPFPTGSVPVPALPEALAGGVVVERPGHDVRRGWADLLVAPGAAVGLCRGGSSDRAYRPVIACPRLDPLGCCGRARLRPPGWLVAATTARSRTHPTTVGNIQCDAALVRRSP